MPAMIRHGKAKKLAFSIIGTPPNFHDKKTPKQKDIEQRIEREEAMRIK